MAVDVSTKADPARAWLMRFSPYLTAGSRVLEIASGNGRNTRLLAGLDCVVTAADINPPAEPIAGVRHLTCDLENAPWPFEGQTFDAVIGINYLWRERFALLTQCVRPGGLFLYETFTRHQALAGFGPKNPAHFLQDGELLTLIPSGWHILAFEDGRTDNNRSLQRIAAVRPLAEDDFERLDVCARR